MRIKHVLTLIGAAAISFSAAAEPTVAASVNSSAAIASVPVVAKAGPRLRTEDYGRLQGVYKLSDGRVLRVTLDRGRMYAELGSTKAEIVPAGSNRFVSHDDAIRVEFDKVPFADVSVSLAGS